jgi:hypothetical protein
MFHICWSRMRPISTTSLLGPVKHKQLIIIMTQ